MEYDSIVIIAHFGRLCSPPSVFQAYQKRRVALIENGSWAPSAAKSMRSMLETMKEIEVVDPVITIRSAMTPENERQIRELAEKLCESYGE